MQPPYETVLAALDLAYGLIEELMLEAIALPRGCRRKLEEITRVLAQADACVEPSRPASGL